MRNVDNDSSRVRLKLQNVCVGYTSKGRGQFSLAVENVSFSLNEGEFVCLLGPSGCGKSTILNAIAGLIKPAAGEILIDGSVVCGTGKDRSVVFQSPALMPWRTVIDNVRYGLDVWRIPRDEANHRAHEMLRLVGLSGREDSYPHELSGGMQQRVNLARALAVNPKLLLLDEPFAALDAQTREAMQVELLRLWSGLHKTALFVTHQIDEAVLLADRVIVFSKGPGRVREIIPVCLERPREALDRRDSRLADIETKIRSLLVDGDSHDDKCH